MGTELLSQHNSTHPTFILQVIYWFLLIWTICEYFQVRPWSMPCDIFWFMHSKYLIWGLRVSQNCKSPGITYPTELLSLPSLCPLQSLPKSVGITHLGIGNLTFIPDHSASLLACSPYICTFSAFSFASLSLWINFIVQSCESITVWASE